MDGVRESLQERCPQYVFSLPWRAFDDPMALRPSYNRRLAQLFILHWGRKAYMCIIPAFSTPPLQRLCIFFRPLGRSPSVTRLKQVLLFRSTLVASKSCRNAWNSNVQFIQLITIKALKFRSRDLSVCGTVSVNIWLIKVRMVCPVRLTDFISSEPFLWMTFGPRKQRKLSPSRIYSCMVLQEKVCMCVRIQVSWKWRSLTVHFLILPL